MKNYFIFFIIVSALSFTCYNEISLIYPKFILDFFKIKNTKNVTNETNSIEQKTIPIIPLVDNLLSSSFNKIFLLESLSITNPSLHDVQIFSEE